MALKRRQVPNDLLARSSLPVAYTASSSVDFTSDSCKHENSHLAQRYCRFIRQVPTYSNNYLLCVKVKRQKACFISIQAISNEKFIETRSFFNDKYYLVSRYVHRNDNANLSTIFTLIYHQLQTGAAVIFLIRYTNISNLTD